MCPKVDHLKKRVLGMKIKFEDNIFFKNRYFRKTYSSNIHSTLNVKLQPILWLNVLTDCKILKFFWARYELFKILDYYVHAKLQICTHTLENTLKQWFKFLARFLGSMANFGPMSTSFDWNVVDS